MKDFIKQIESALNSNLYLVALFSSLAIPDICGAAESENGFADKQKYIDWYDKHAKHISSFLSGEDCYYFRCSLLHQGSTQHLSGTHRRILFVEPGSTACILHNNIMNGALNIDVRIFCTGMLMAARTWIIQNENTEKYKRNMEKFVQRYPQGLLPYISGAPVIS
ncbi:MAG: hypothetical protein V1721_08015 [Pseudomonadota bacterium]